MRSAAAAFRRLSSPVSLISPELGCASAGQRGGRTPAAVTAAVSVSTTLLLSGNRSRKATCPWAASRFKTDWLSAPRNMVPRIAGSLSSTSQPNQMLLLNLPVSTTMRFSVVAGSLSMTAAARCSCAAASSSPA